jgi:hypothetical protein
MLRSVITHLVTIYLLGKMGAQPSTFVRVPDESDSEPVSPGPRRHSAPGRIESVHDGGECAFDEAKSQNLRNVFVIDLEGNLRSATLEELALCPNATIHSHAPTLSPLTRKRRRAVEPEQPFPKRYNFPYGQIDPGLRARIQGISSRAKIPDSTVDTPARSSHLSPRILRGRTVAAKRRMETRDQANTPELLSRNASSSAQRQHNKPSRPSEQAVSTKHKASMTKVHKTRNKGKAPAREEFDVRSVVEPPTKRRLGSAPGPSPMCSEDLTHAVQPCQYVTRSHHGKGRAGMVSQSKK